MMACRAGFESGNAYYEAALAAWTVEHAWSVALQDLFVDLPSHKVSGLFLQIRSEIACHILDTFRHYAMA
jgi:hypothetical protein